MEGGGRSGSSSRGEPDEWQQAHRLPGKRVEKSLSYDWYGVAPAGQNTSWKGSASRNSRGGKASRPIRIGAFKVKSCKTHKSWVDEEDIWVGSYTVHAADPRVKIEGVMPREPWFNTTIAVSDRWLHPKSSDHSTRAWCMLELMLAAMNRAARPAILNHYWLDAPRLDARKLDQAYLQNSRLNQQTMTKAFGAGLNHTAWAQWSRNPVTSRVRLLFSRTAPSGLPAAMDRNVSSMPRQS
jgi:hypothetical protein